MQRTQRGRNVSKVNLIINTEKFPCFAKGTEGALESCHRRAWNNLSLNSFKNSLGCKLAKSNVRQRTNY